MLEHVTLTWSGTGKAVLCPLTLKAMVHFLSWSYHCMMKAYDPLLGETTDGDVIVVRVTGRVM